MAHSCCFFAPINSVLTFPVSVPPPHQCTVQVKLELGHRAQLRKKVTSEGFTHDWMVFVRGPETGDIQHFVDKVVFRLHESFPKPKRGEVERLWHCCRWLCAVCVMFICQIRWLRCNVEEVNQLLWRFCSICLQVKNIVLLSGNLADCAAALMFEHINHCCSAALCVGLTFPWWSDNALVIAVVCSVQGAAVQSGGVGLRGLPHADRGLLQEQGEADLG